MLNALLLPPPNVTVPPVTLKPPLVVELTPSKSVKGADPPLLVTVNEPPDTLCPARIVPRLNVVVLNEPDA